LDLLILELIFCLARSQLLLVVEQFLLLIPAPWFCRLRVEKLPEKGQTASASESAAAETEEGEKEHAEDLLSRPDEGRASITFALFPRIRPSFGAAVDCAP